MRKKAREARERLRQRQQVRVYLNLLIPISTGGGRDDFGPVLAAHDAPHVRQLTCVDAHDVYVCVQGDEDRRLRELMQAKGKVGFRGVVQATRQAQEKSQEDRQGCVWHHISAGLPWMACGCHSYP